MTSQLYTYSLIRSFYDKGQDYIDSFWPLVLSLLPADGAYVSLNNIQDGIEEKFRLNIPQHSLEIIATRATRKGYILRRDRAYRLTESGLNHRTILESEKEAERRINELLEDAKNHIELNHKLVFSLEEIRTILQAFVHENLELVEWFCNTENGSKESTYNDALKDHERALLDYFANVERAKPSIFKTLQDIIFGSIISVIVHSNLFSESNKQFKKTQIYLDANFVFSLLGMRHPEMNRPAQELFNLMASEEAFEFRIFDFSIEEMTSLLRSYDKEKGKYVPGIKVNSLFSSLRTKGWTASDVTEFIANIEKNLWEKKIVITSTTIDTSKYEPIDENRRSSLAKYKIDQKKREQNHDLAAIERIKEFRKNRRTTKIEECHSMFLTSDLRLAKFNYLEDKHRDQKTISEVIPDRLFTNILWLKKPSVSSNLPLSSIIAIHSRHLFVDQDVWKVFYTTISKLRVQGDISDKDISVLLYDKQIQEVLSEQEPEGIEKDWILENVLEARKRLESREQVLSNQKEEAERQITLKENALESLAWELEIQKIATEKISNDYTDGLKSLEERITQSEQQKIDAIGVWKKTKKIEAENQVKIIVWATFILAAALIIGISYYFRPFIQNHWNNIEPIAWLVENIKTTLGLLLAALFFFGGIPIQKESWIKEKLFDKFYRKKLAGIKEIEVILGVNHK